MPWKECSVMDERLRFVARLLDGEAMSEVCRAFGISRKTGYKIFERYKEHGLGVAPVIRRSGKACVVVRRYDRNKRLENALYHWARLATQELPPSADLGRIVLESWSHNSRARAGSPR
jgi:helix-turn-helix protein